jgi:hypothetical protein
VTGLDVLHRETLDVVAVDFQALADALTAPNR